MKKRVFALLLSVLLLLCGCAKTQKPQAPVLVTTTEQLLQMTKSLLTGTELEKTAVLKSVVSEPVSCVHDYTLSVNQMKLLESADAVIEVGLGFEDFMGSALSSVQGRQIIASDKITPLTGDEGPDPHIWLSPVNCKQMVQNIANALCECYPDSASRIALNAERYCDEMDSLLEYGKNELKDLSCRSLVTFHDGFSYFAEAFDLTIAAAMEIEAGSEPSAKELEAVIETVQNEKIPAVFAEKNGTTDAAELVAAQTGTKVAVLDMGLSGGDAITYNIDTVKEVLQ